MAQYTVAISTTEQIVMTKMGDGSGWEAEVYRRGTIVLLYGPDEEALSRDAAEMLA